MAQGELEPKRLDRLSASFPGPADATIGALCIVCSALVGVMGAGVVLMPGGRLIGAAGVSDPTTEAIEELQFTFGEGPAVDACRSREPVLVPDLVASGPSRWPSFVGAAVLAGVHAVFGVPLLMRSVCIGGLDLYHDEPGALTDEQMADATAVAQLATRAVLGWQAAAEAGMLAWQLEEFPNHRAEVHQATGMVSVQARVSVDDAQTLLRAYSFVENRPISDVARDIVRRTLDLG